MRHIFLVTFFNGDNHLTDFPELIRQLVFTPQIGKIPHLGGGFLWVESCFMDSSRKAKKTPASDMTTAKQRKARYEGQQMNKHIGSDYDNFLAEQGLIDEVSAAALKRTISWQLAEIMKLQRVTRKALAERMQISRTAVDRTLDLDDASMTLAVLALGDMQPIACECLP